MTLAYIISQFVFVLRYRTITFKNESSKIIEQAAIVIIGREHFSGLACQARSHELLVQLVQLAQHIFHHLF